MPRAGTSKRRRARAGLPEVRPGKVSWVHDTKLTFFQAHKEAYLAAAEIKETGNFYTRIGQLYLKKYVYNTGWHEDLDEGKDCASDVEEDEDEEDDLTAEEGEARAAYFKTLRGKIGVWYNGQYGGSVEKKVKSVMSFKELFNKVELAPPVPVKSRVIHFYSRRFYQEGIKDHVAARWAVASRRPNPPTMIRLVNDVMQDAWDGETQMFKDEVLAAIDLEYKLAMEAHTLAISGETPRTPEEYNVVHSGMSKGLVPRVWSDYDHAGFEAIQRSFVDFSHQCFTEEECRERSLNGMAMAEGDGNAVIPAPPESDAQGDVQAEGEVAVLPVVAGSNDGQAPVGGVPLNLPQFDPLSFDPTLFAPPDSAPSTWNFRGMLLFDSKGEDRQGEEEENSMPVETLCM
ncbi:hypothetical protein DFH09DRAFT_1330284 [Mycena vulgaris]|nr:hypothetical protein DFH09DRAFT_1330284 [Mycena vulgaris]